MSLAIDILTEGKKLKNKYQYTSDPAVVRNPDGTLNFTDDKMDCSEFFLFSVKQASPGLYKELLDQSLGSKEGGNTKTIQVGIKRIEGWADLSNLKQSDPQVGDWILWRDHIEMIEEITSAGRYITLGANGSVDSLVPKNIDSRNFDSVKRIASNFLGIWTPNIDNQKNAALINRIEMLERRVNEMSFASISEHSLLSNHSFKAIAFTGPVADLHTPVHLRTNNTNASLEATPPQGQAFPLYEGEGMPFNTSDEANTKIQNLSQVIGFLRVSDAAHERYIAAGSNTFCNVYAYDLCYLMGYDISKFYIPRVWWTEQAVDNINNGLPQVPVYGTTVREMTANDLHYWFEVFGSNFGWLRESDLNNLQEFVNTTGDVGIIVGKKPGGHGHITVVVPEQSAQPVGVFSAVRNAAGNVINPLQSQAGSRNFEYGNLTIGTAPWFNAGGHISAMYVFNRI